MLLSLSGRDAATHLLHHHSSVPKQNYNQLYVQLLPGNYTIDIHSFGVLPARSPQTVYIRSETLEGPLCLFVCLFVLAFLFLL